jgi:uncharacterized protein
MSKQTILLTRTKEFFKLLTILSCFLAVSLTQQSLAQQSKPTKSSEGKPSSSVQQGSAQPKQIIRTSTTLEGFWHGKIQLEELVGYDVYIEFTKHEQNGGVSYLGWLDIPAQRVGGLPLKNIQFDGRKLDFTMKALRGVSTSFSAKKVDTTIQILSTSVLIGSMKQGGIQYTFKAMKTDSNESPMNVQVGTKTTTTYSTEQEVRIDVSDSVKLAGSFVTPLSVIPRRFPCVLFINGSGQQDRDETIYGFKPFKVLADSFAKWGIASLRCDDRAIGGSRGDVFSFTTRDLANDAAGCIDWIKQQPQVDTNNIVIVGHSEGGIIAGMLSAERKDIASLILLASPATKGSDIINDQVHANLKHDQLSQSDIDSIFSEQNKIYEMARTGKGLDKFEKKLFEEAKVVYANYPQEQRQYVIDSTDAIRSIAQAKYAQVTMPWFKFFIDYDPALDLQKVKIPILALYGQLDKQVNPDMNEVYMKRIINPSKAGERKVLIKILNKCNHLFQTAKTGHIMEYNTLKKEFNEEFVNVIYDWTKKQILR